MQLPTVPSAGRASCRTPNGLVRKDRLKKVFLSHELINKHSASLLLACGLICGRSGNGFFRGRERITYLVWLVLLRASGYSCSAAVISRCWTSGLIAPGIRKNPAQLCADQPSRLHAWSLRLLSDGSVEQLPGKAKCNARQCTWMTGKAHDLFAQNLAVSSQNRSAMPCGAIQKVQHPRQICWYLSELASTQLAFPDHAQTQH